MSPVTVYVPRDSAARAVGADAVAESLLEEARRRGLAVHLVRNSSRGLFWLEPLVEVKVGHSRLAYGPVSPEHLPGLFDSGFLEGGNHALAQGPMEAHPYLQQQERLTFARMGLTDPLSLSDYQEHAGWSGLHQALTLSPQQIVQEVLDSGLRGRGGAGFPAGIKWKTVLNAPALQKYIVVNADEGDSGTFADRMVLEGDPFMLIEGMIIAGLAVGATKGYVYIRSEYPDAVAVMTQAVELARQAGYLGPDILASGHAFDLQVRKAAGAYVCGEETALLESLEGKRGIVRAKPPLPAVQGLFGQPTVINNVLTLAAVPFILARGAQAYATFGLGRSRGTLPFQLAGNIRQGGLVEKAFGVTLRQLVEDFGGGTQSGRPVRAIQVGGPLGSYLPPALLDTPMDYEALSAVGGTLGHGGLVVFDDTVDMAQQAHYAMTFCAQESCGKCTPCRIGSTRGAEVIETLQAHPERAPQQAALLKDLCDTMLHGSLCAMGGMTPFPVLSALKHFPRDFHLPAESFTAP